MGGRASKCKAACGDGGVPVLVAGPAAGEEAATAAHVQSVHLRIDCSRVHVGTGTVVVGHQISSSYTTVNAISTPSLHLGLLGNDLLVEILSFVGSTPFDDEAETYKASGNVDACAFRHPAENFRRSHEQLLIIGRCHVPSTSCFLTHTLPCVSKQFRYLCDTSEVLWFNALRRMLRSNPVAWEERVLALVEGRLCGSNSNSESKRGNGGCGFGDIDQSPPWAWGGRDSPLWKFRVRFKGRSISLLSDTELTHYIDLLCQVVGHRHEHERSQRQPTHEADNATLPPNEIAHAKRIVMHLIRSTIVRTLPLLHYPIRHRIRIGSLLRLDLFDARCGPIFSAITAKRTKRELKTDSSLTAPLPEFVLVTGAARPQEGIHAYLVELHRCHLKAGRWAEFFVVPMEHISIVELDEKDEENGVFDASFRMVPQK